MPDQTPEPLTDDEVLTATCTVCATGIQWIECPTGGWWAHDVHPADNHDAVSPVNVIEDVDDHGQWFTVGLETSATVLKLLDQLEAARARITEFEAAQPETVGYVVAARRDDGEFFGATIWTGQAQAESMAVTASAYHRESFRVFELQEVRDDA